PPPLSQPHAPGALLGGGDLPQAGLRVGEKFLERGAVVVLPPALRAGGPVPLAAPLAQSLPAAGRAGGGVVQPFLQEFLLPPSGAEGGQRRLVDVAQLPLVQGEEVAGVNA